MWMREVTQFGIKLLNLVSVYGKGHEPYGSCHPVA